MLNLPEPYISILQMVQIKHSNEVQTYILGHATCSTSCKPTLHHYIITSCHIFSVLNIMRFRSFFDGNESSDIFGMCNIIRFVRLYGAHNSFAVRNKFFLSDCFKGNEKKKNKTKITKSQLIQRTKQVWHMDRVRQSKNL